MDQGRRPGEGRVMRCNCQPPFVQRFKRAHTITERLRGNLLCARCLPAAGPPPLPLARAPPAAAKHPITFVPRLHVKPVPVSSVSWRRAELGREQQATHREGQLFARARSPPSAHSRASWSSLGTQAVPRPQRALREGRATHSVRRHRGGPRPRAGAAHGPPTTLIDTTTSRPHMAESRRCCLV